MPQIAQQDYKIIEIGDYEALTYDEKVEIKRAVDAGIIFDCIFHYDTIFFRALGVSPSENEVYVSVSGTDVTFDIAIE